VSGAVGFYVTVRNGSRKGFLLGPYETHGEALANVDRSRRHVEDHHAYAWGWGFGTAKATAKPGRRLPPGKLNDRIGLTGEGEAA
jgi:hypothetical protein